MSLLRAFSVTAVTALSLLATAGPAPAKTTWLCRPGLAANPCKPGLSTTVYSNDGQALRVDHPKATPSPKVDCFYVYPTVSDQTTTLANFHVDPEERSIALYQAARYSQRCRVFAPMYRQVTVPTLFATGTETAQQLATGLADVRSAFKDFLAHENKGRPFVLIGHSQGSFLLRRLIKLDVDGKAAIRKRMLSAILLGGNVEVKKGSDVGGDFKHIRACHSNTQLACVVAFSTFDTPVLPKSLFGRPTGADGSPAAGTSVLCTNPAALGGGSAPVKTIVPSAPFAPGTLIAAGITILGLTQPTPSTPWVSEPGAYRAGCSAAGGAHVLQVTPQPGAQVPKPSPDGTWGLHLLDANIALGNLVDLVGKEAAAYAKRR